MAANIQFRIASKPNKANNESRDDLVAGDVLRICNMNPGTVNTLQVLWIPPGDAATISANGALSTFSDSGLVGWQLTVPNSPGTYMFKLTVDDAFIIRGCSILTPNRGLRIPALSERGHSDASAFNRTTDIQKATNYAITTTDPRSNGELNPFGYQYALEKLFTTVDAIAGDVDDHDERITTLEEGSVGGGDAWQQYCDFNFTQMANRLINVDGDLTIEGVTMQAGNVAGGHTTLNIVNGSGLVFAAANAMNTYWYHTAHLAAWLGIDMDRIEGWMLGRSEARIFVEGYLTTGTANFATMSFGFTKRLNFISTDWSPMMRHVYSAGKGRDCHFVYGSTEEAYGFEEENNANMVHFKTQNELNFFAKIWAGANSDSNDLVFDDVDTFQLVGRHLEARTLGQGPRVKPADKMMAFVCGQNGNTVGNTVCTVKRMRVEYKL